MFENGDRHKFIQDHAFERVYAVFDRDDHESYDEALALAASLNGKLRNDAKQPVIFQAVPSVPCFELWLLLHFEDIQSPMHRDEVISRLKQHMTGYDKASDRLFSITQDRLPVASQRAQRLASRFTAYSAPEPFTAVGELVAVLKGLRA